MKADKGKLDSRFKCPYCQELFSNYGDWLKHMKGCRPLIYTCFEIILLSPSPQRAGEEERESLLK